MAHGVSAALRSGHGLAVLAVIIAAVPLLGGSYLTTVALSILVSFVLAQSWDWLGGEMGYLNLGHYAFYGIGAYGFCLSVVGGAGLVPAFAMAVFAPAAFAALLAVPIFRLRGDYFAFATLAIVPLCGLLADNLSFLTQGSEGVSLPPHYVLMPAYAMAGTLAIVTLVATLAITGSRMGYALKAIRNDEQAAEIVGVRVFPAKLRILMVSAGFAGLAGAIQAWQFSFIDPDSMFGLSFALVPVAMALLGGSGLLWGPLVGVVVLVAIQQVVLIKLSMLQATVYGATILLIGRYLPGGLLRARVLQRVPFLAPLGREHHARLRHDSAAADALPLAPVPAASGHALFECRDLTLSFGGLVAVDHVTLSVRQGEIIGLVGPNGSGKTSLFNLISGVYRPKSGEMLLDGGSLAGLRRDEVARLGIGRTYQIPRPFGDLTVRENIATALMFRASGCGLGAAMAEAASFASFAGLARRLETRADGLGLQERKALEFARALAGRPRLLLIDEVAAGLSTAEVRRFVEHIRDIRDRYGITVIWVEHIFSALARVVDRLVVLDAGRVIADAPLAEAVADTRVLTTYLGAATGTGR
jgi:branched-chain amino acid transport system permease protein